MNKARPIGTLLVLVHGAWHSSLHWASTQRHLARLGVASLAVDLPGHGVNAPVPSGYFTAGQPGLESEKSAVADISLQDGARMLTNVLAGVRAQADRLVVVAHSANGGVASMVAEQAPQLVDQLVYLAAFVPAGRPRFTDYHKTPEFASGIELPMVGEPAALGAYRINHLSADPAVVEAIRMALFNDLPADAGDGWRQFLHPDEPLESLTGLVEVTADRWGRIPRAYIRLIDDMALSVVAQDLMIAEADRFTPDAPFTVHSLPGGHSPFVTRPAELAELLAAISGVEISQ
jgi:pimeloyl-ACP methyl ester carboxylesterase